MAEVNNNRTTLRSNAHPLYTAMIDCWTLGRDSFAGEPAIKDKRGEYLPATAGMRQDGFGSGKQNNEGDAAYTAYITRAYYPDVFSEAVESAVGVMHRKPANIELSPKLKVLAERATDDGEDLQLLLRKINSMQLTTGRLGLLGVLEEKDGKTIPKLVVHNDASLFNWDDTASEDSTQDLRMLQVDESNYEMTPDFTWEWKNKVRVLALTSSDSKIVGFDNEGALEKGVYSYAMLDDTNISIKTATFEHLGLKGKQLDRIPFTFINSKDLSTLPDKPPLDGLARLALAIYRGEADYRQNLFMQGQDTLVCIGGIGGEDDDGAVRTGAGARLDVPINGDAKYIGVSGGGLSEQRESLKADYEKADKKTSKLMASGGGQESGEALKIRVAAQTATLPQIAQTGAAGLEKVLRDLAEWLGDNPLDVVVTPNLEFTSASGDGQTLSQIVASKIQGAPISDISIHAWMSEQGFTTKTYEEELSLINEEAPKLNV